MSRDVLFLCHRVPFPPNKGEKIRAFHILRHLSRDRRVHLATFVDDPVDASQASALEEYCASMQIETVSQATALRRTVSGLWQGLPLSVARLGSRRIRRFTGERLDSGEIGSIFVYSSAMGQYLPAAPRGVRVVVDFVDVDSDKWSQYARDANPPMGWVYRREARRLLAYDRRLAAQADAALFVSDVECDLFRQLAPEVAGRVHTLRNGVDVEYFDPGKAAALAEVAGRPLFVFTGAMDYRPNVDAVSWFVREIFPDCSRRWPEAGFMIVGSNPTAEVRNLQSMPRVVVTGRVTDVRPYLSAADVVVAPMRLARGIQNKVLEGMSMSKPVVTTPNGHEGIGAEPGRHLLVATEPQDIASAIGEALQRRMELGRSAREFVVDSYGWNTALSELDRHFA